MSCFTGTLRSQVLERNVLCSARLLPFSSGNAIILRNLYVSGDCLFSQDLMEKIAINSFPFFKDKLRNETFNCLVEVILISASMWVTIFESFHHCVRVVWPEIIFCVGHSIRLEFSANKRQDIFKSVLLCLQVAVVYLSVLLLIIKQAWQCISRICCIWCMKVFWPCICCSAKESGSRQVYFLGMLNFMLVLLRNRELLNHFSNVYKDCFEEPMHCCGLFF